MSGDEKSKQAPEDVKAEKLADRVQSWQSEGQAILRTLAQEMLRHHKAIVAKPALIVDDTEDRSDDDRVSCE